MGADYSIELISIETYAPQFIEHNKIFLGSVNFADPGGTFKPIGFNNQGENLKSDD